MHEGERSRECEEGRSHCGPLTVVHGPHRGPRQSNEIADLEAAKAVREETWRKTQNQTRNC